MMPGESRGERYQLAGKSLIESKAPHRQIEADDLCQAQGDAAHPEGRVLEVRGGDSPSPRSDVLVDFALEPRERWGGRIERDDRPLVLARGEALPFRDKSFDYVIAFHVLEHSEHPEVFLS
jgi:Methyltransferase domain